MKKIIITLLLCLFVFSCSIDSTKDSHKTGSLNNKIDFSHKRNIISSVRNIFSNANIVDLNSLGSLPNIYRDSLINVSQNKPIVVSAEYETFVATNINDGNPDTLWGALAEEPQWFYVDLETEQYIKKIRLDWFLPYFATKFYVGFSLDGENWIINNGVIELGNDDYTLYLSNNQPYRYVGILLENSNTIGFGVNEFEVWATPKENKFISKWTIKETNIPLEIPLDPDGKYDFYIDWGDGSIDQCKTSIISHKYDKPGDYIVIIDGTCEGFGTIFNGQIWRLKDVLHWGNIKLHNNGYQFSGLKLLTHFSATDPLDLSNITNMASMFENATSFNGNISHWDFSNVTTMERMFFNAKSFNQDLNWGDKTKNVTTMKEMFDEANAFNGDISDWNVSSVETMEMMFFKATSFNQDIIWGDNAKNVKNTYGMFCNAYKFNGDISSWNVSSITTMFGMFSNAIAFNRDLSTWKFTDKLKSIKGMFSGAKLYNNGNFPEGLNKWAIHKKVDIGTTLFEDSSLTKYPIWYNTQNPD